MHRYLPLIFTYLPCISYIPYTPVVVLRTYVILCTRTWERVCTCMYMFVLRKQSAAERSCRGRSQLTPPAGFPTFLLNEVPMHVWSVKHESRRSSCNRTPRHSYSWNTWRKPCWRQGALEHCDETVHIDTVRHEHRCRFQNCGRPQRTKSQISGELNILELCKIVSLDMHNTDKT